MQYTFFINYNSVVTQVYPLNFLETLLVDEKEQGQEFYRRKFEGTLTFGGKKLCTDFDLFYTIEQAAPYAHIDFLILQNLDIYWEGYFSTANGTWNLKDKTFTIAPKTTDDYSDWAENGDLQYNILDIPAEILVHCNGFDYTHNRWLSEVILFVANEVFPGCTIATNFFTYATDYVTLQPSKLLYLTIAQKSDIKRPIAADPATTAMLSFNEMMDILRGMFNVYWTYDLASNILRVEHLTYFTAVAGLDLTTQDIGRSMLTYRRETENMPKYEKWNFMERSSADFIGSIHYDSPVVQSESTDEFNCRVTTEIEIIQTNADSVSDDGFVILCNYISGGLYYTYLGPGVIDSVTRYNMPLSWSYLLLSYHRHGRVLLDGYFSNGPVTFNSARKTILHDINAIVCPEDLYSPLDYITTELGEDYFSGLKGYVKRANIKPYGEINFNLKYGPLDNANEGWTITSKSLYVTLNDATGEVRTELSQPNIYDTYYSIWTNDDTCDVITILAGVLIQDDLLTQINPIVTVKYNFSDVSLTGWTLYVNGSTTFTTCIDAECDSGAPAPPAIPDVPDILGHGQATTCGPIAVNWTAEVGATYYVLQRKPDLGGADVWQSQYIGAAISYDDTNAGTQEGVTFFYRAAAGNITGLSAWSAEHEVNDVMC